MKVLSVVGARPNFVKLAPIHHKLKGRADHIIVHTGQHYDNEMSNIFFKDLMMPEPDYNLHTGAGYNVPAQLGNMIERIAIVIAHEKPDIVLVYGDTTSTLAGALASNKTGTMLAHIEAGLRSFDRSMAEEVNRVLTDNVSDFLFTPTETATRNLIDEKIRAYIAQHGDIAVEEINEARSRVDESISSRDEKYVLFTMHRVENTDNAVNLERIVSALERVNDIEIIFPIHPRTKNRLVEYGLMGRLFARRNIRIIEPLGYNQFITAMNNASKIVTDSGGVQKEAYILGVPCVTMRDRTEWVETVDAGWNILVGTDITKIITSIQDWIPTGERPAIFGDGKASTKIVDTILDLDKRNTLLTKKIAGLQQLL